MKISIILRQDVSLLHFGPQRKAEKKILNKYFQSEKLDVNGDSNFTHLPLLNIVHWLHFAMM